MHRIIAQVSILALLAFGSACRDEGGDPPKDSGPPTEGGSNDDGSGGPATPTTIFKINDGTMKEGKKVLLKDVIVSAVDGYGSYTGDIYVQESAGGLGSGTKIFNGTRLDGTIDDLKPGDHVKIEGVVKYYTPKTPFNDTKHPNKKHIKELEKAQITRISQGSPPVAKVLTAKDVLTDPSADGWEHVLVQIKDLKVTGPKDATYGDFPVKDSTYSGLDVDDDMYPHTPTLDECLTVTGVMAYWYGYRINPRKAADIAKGTNCPTTKTIKISDIQDTTSANHPKENDDVKVVGVVTAIDTTPSSSGGYTGFFLQEEAGGPYSGIYVYYYWKDSKSAPPLGDKIELSGTYTEYKQSTSTGKGTVSELKSVQWTSKGKPTTAPTPAVVSASDVKTGGSKAEQYEGVLVTVSNITVGDTLTDTAKPPKNVGFKDSTTSLHITNDFYDFMKTAPTKGTVYTSITGPLQFSFDDFKVIPRSATDMVKK